jgi:hypothetical protein
MKKFLTILAVLTVFATPAFAQSRSTAPATCCRSPMRHMPMAAARSPRAQIGVHQGKGIVERPPADVDPYVVYNLARSQAN